MQIWVAPSKYVDNGSIVVEVILLGYWVAYRFALLGSGLPLCYH